MPLALADHLNPLIQDIFDRDAAKGYARAKTKIPCILNGAVAPESLSELVCIMQRPHTHHTTDGSNATGLIKMNPLTVRIFVINCGK